ncbi:MAG TPA: succinate dehydrogenase assembly factor 2 [Rhodocyclaceae bacterium]|nr:MAG: hypothetical protein AUK49_11730 [Betaproteobacteria bacterium CG2_30_68_42]PIV71705.1 MAG: succinate dehydrogenase assembly factor 2 [Rhodocyclales bacterium CG17_big_fil_post_rev_8_21_14_2_50_68_7]PIX75830.1 MAG: succinate dehydrogenase assembly factor 2 [Rhodocyclales bacterium CG_4_10_14_3_um_filter_68_10]PJA58261.1 MAG: succinate dehydrogenase assembly factor 2 [Rhodocyclales bacterium CG_4_9_14_3_um_filter_68_10]HCX32615.1 succinate dehydrogenase assembly factor 2 [Rhodocyclaceae 
MTTVAGADVPLGRLRWHCMRRGLLELDLVLQRFAQRELDGLDAAGRAALDRLLDYDDLELWEIVCGRRECEDARLKGLVALLRAQ